MGNDPPRPAFGRRAPRPVARASASPAPKPPRPGIGWIDHDQALDDWKSERRWRLPWRQISLTASLCFGIASLVLPEAVNDRVQWLLYALTAISLFSGLRRRRM